jgi:hypothetical protein
MNNKATKELTIAPIILLNILLKLSFFRIIVADSSPSCIDYESSERVIKITCQTANLADIDNQLNNNDILENESDSTDDNKSEVWLLKANLKWQKELSLPSVQGILNG